ncbi:ATPase, partial [Intestinimonas massiliensis]|nr:ATPase [Intestinimonas massiliensis (ex Afouda et al. 2020)]
VDGPLGIQGGDPFDVLLDRSTHVLTGAGAVPLTPEWKERISRTNMELSLEGLRVLALAYMELPEVRDLTLDDERDFTFIGLVSMIDPPRPEAVQAVADAKR